MYLKHSDFPHGDLLHHLIVLALQELLDGDVLAGLLVLTLEHHAVASLPDDAQVLVLLHAAGTYNAELRAGCLRLLLLRVRVVEGAGVMMVGCNPHRWLQNKTQTS